MIVIGTALAKQPAGSCGGMAGAAVPGSSPVAGCSASLVPARSRGRVSLSLSLTVIVSVVADAGAPSAARAVRRAADCSGSLVPRVPLATAAVGGRRLRTGRPGARTEPLPAAAVGGRMATTAVGRAAQATGEWLAAQASGRMVAGCPGSPAPGVPQPIAEAGGRVAMVAAAARAVGGRMARSGGAARAAVEETGEAATRSPGKPVPEVPPSASVTVCTLSCMGMGCALVAPVCACVCVCLRVRVRACVRARVRACVRANVCAWCAFVASCVRVGAHVWVLAQRFICVAPLVCVHVSDSIARCGSLRRRHHQQGAHELLRPRDCQGEEWGSPRA